MSREPIPGSEERTDCETAESQRSEAAPAVDLAHDKRRLGDQGRLWHSQGVNDNEIGLPLTALADQEEWQLLPALLPEWIGDL